MTLAISSAVSSHPDVIGRVGGSNPSPPTKEVKNWKSRNALEELIAKGGHRENAFGD